MGVWCWRWLIYGDGLYSALNWLLFIYAYGFVSFSLLVADSFALYFGDDTF